MPPEFPRPTYPGDFVSCNFYDIDIASGAFGQIELTADEPGPFTLTLPHDGLLRDMLYEVIFGPFAFTIQAAGADEANIGFTVYHGSDEETSILYSETLLEFNIRTLVPAITCFFYPGRGGDLVNLPAVIPANTFSIDFGFAGGETNWGQIEFGLPTVFGVRPVDQTDSDTFRYLPAFGQEVPYVP